MATRAPRYKFEPITVKEPHRYDVKTFTDPDEFTAYYRQHEDDFKGVSTAVLNRTYKIPGYRISVVKRGTEQYTFHGRVKTDQLLVEALRNTKAYFPIRITSSGKTTDVK